MSSGSSAAVPCVVVVDSRNVRGQGRKVFGHGRETPVSGVRAGLLRYGLDASEIIVGVGTRTSRSSPSARLSEALQKNQAFAHRLVGGGATVLEGHLVERSGVVEEKQVDVLCALAVADAADRIARGVSQCRCIVVLSEDMDLMPAIEFAERRGVPTYAAAYDTVHLRPSQKEWLLLHEGALKDICDPPGRDHGSVLRAKLASIAANAANAPALTWKVVAPRMDDGRAMLSSNFGANGLWKPSRKLQRGDRLNLYIDGMDIDPHGGRFPFATLSDAKPTAMSSDLDLADVLFWMEPTQVKIRVRGSQHDATLRAAPGSLMPGDEVLVRRERKSGNLAHYLVGPTSATTAPPQWPLSENVGLVELVEEPASTSRAWLQARLVGSGVEVGVKASYLGHARAGARLMVSLAGLNNRNTPLTMPLTCCLPSAV